MTVIMNPRDHHMNARICCHVFAIWLACGAGAASATVPEAEGEVRLPLETYTGLIDQGRVESRPAPAAYAIGVSRVRVRIDADDDNGGGVASVIATLRIEVLEDEWTSVPILPTATALTRATANGAPVQLVSTPQGLAFTTDKAGVVSLELAYGVDARRAGAGFVLPLPVPRAAATELLLDYSGTDADFAVVPAVGVQVQTSGNATRLTASVPSTTSIMVSWRTLSDRPFAMSRAHYRGELRGDALLWEAQYDVEIFVTEPVTLALMPISVTLGDLRIDGERATVLEEDGRFATVLHGKGMHSVQVSFQTPVEARDGPPVARLALPRVPVSSFELELPGHKELVVQPRAHVETESREGSTIARVSMPMSAEVVFSWVDAVPEDLRAQARANASLYHAVHAEEGVLHVRALVLYEISRGETTQLQIDLPRDTQVNRILTPSGGLSDWTEAPLEGSDSKRVTVFLDRAVNGEFVLDIAYERLIGSAERDQPVSLPLLSAVDVHRQRGMVALLAGPELVLDPVTELRVTRVGENQLPAEVRNQIQMAVVHTYKYTDSTAEIRVKAMAPERVQGKFDARVDTLISIGDVAMKGAASVTVSVKSGSIMALTLGLPTNVNVLGVTGPSIRSHEIEDAANAQEISLSFTQEMEGQFRLEVNYELIMADGADEIPVPTVSVDGAEVEHGRIAVEALSAVEVQAAVSDQLSTLDLNELPRQLVLKTSNPILLAYKYAQPPYRLALRITRHREIDVQVAAIDTAQYSTLFTRDGLAVTTARFNVRNSRRQFLRLDLPPDTDIWSVFADGKPEKPAHAGKEPNDGAVLIKMINSTEGFPVEIVYASRVPPMGFLGTVDAWLPKPDMVVTHTRWDVFLPVGPTYRPAQANLDVIVQGEWVDPRTMGAQSLAAMEATAGQLVGRPLQIKVPTRGVHFAFEKLYANQSPELPRFSIRYTSSEGSRLGIGLSVLATILLWIAVFTLGGWRAPLPRMAIVAGFVIGAGALVVSIGYLNASPVLAAVLTLVVAVLAALWFGIRRIARWQRNRASDRSFE